MRRTFPAHVARLLGQATTAWALAYHLLDGDLGPSSPFVLGFGVAALAVTLRRAEGGTAPAVACFAAALLTGGLVAGWVVDAGLVLIGMGPSGGVPTGYLLLMVASVLFVTAGAFFWIRRGEDA